MKLDLKKISIGTVLIIIFVIISISLFNFNRKNSENSIKNQKLKALNKTYTKNIDLSVDAINSISPTSEIKPTSMPSLVPTLILSPTAVAKIPTPTEIILAKSVSPIGNTTITPNSELPSSGLIEGTLAIFAVSLSFIIFAFIF
ncbi:MAG: hypothetical protein UR89_C0019G0013 [Candidatus Roizmanbacteria bacterium GW2011_GWA2_35_8]|uniref:Uncharacterized protein n=1 Tax=Candidatus Roizmanbacteria bacterium GW2011_GWA2_35_8 TaxID=1618479 RepID=A0A0G0CXC8_9BACT|nr:MAG: hypothetical protein UR89_C0019G0013 [Candidatus Roizmanbacteria bacterium GW2011_GWA2_35_8]